MSGKDRISRDGKVQEVCGLGGRWRRQVEAAVGLPALRCYFISRWRWEIGAQGEAGLGENTLGVIGM